MNTDNTCTIGARGEDHVCCHLSRNGYTIVDRNFRYKTGEIDIIARHDDTLCFIEVRTRENTKLGHPAETITPKKMKTIRRTAEAYMIRKKIRNCAVRFDAITIVWDTMELEHFRNAF